MRRLEFNSNGVYLKTVDNVLIVLEYDPALKDKIAFDEFANRGLVLGALPWDAREERRPWASSDDAGIYHYIEKVYGIAVDAKINNALTLITHKKRFNDVRRYLEGLTWDGVPRLDTLFTDYLGAEDSLYTRAVSRKSFTAAVARAMEPGVKWDYMPILAGLQGLGKSTFLRYMGKDWYSDSLTTFEGKDAMELIQGVWLNEVGELTGMSKSESNAVKQFLSRTEDIYREAYGKRTMPYPRRCVFFGTTNDSEFLRDRTGNRRFWPIDVGIVKPTKSVFQDLKGEVDQIYAEAFVRWQLSEPLYLSGEIEDMAKERQEAHRESSAKEGIIQAFVSRDVPADWQKRDLPTRRMYWSGEFGKPQEGEEAPGTGYVPLRFGANASIRTSSILSSQIHEKLTVYCLASQGGKSTKVGLAHTTGSEVFGKNDLDRLDKPSWTVYRVSNFHFGQILKCPSECPSKCPRKNRYISIYYYFIGHFGHFNS